LFYKKANRTKKFLNFAAGDVRQRQFSRNGCNISSRRVQQVKWCAGDMENILQVNKIFGVKL